MGRPNPTAGLRHVALNVQDLEAAERFYTELLGMQVEWRPDSDNVYLSSGNDNLALHRCSASAGQAKTHQALDHIGFILERPDDVDAWHDFLRNSGVTIKAAVRKHRDGARSFYVEGPEQVTVQMIYHPPLGRK